MKIFITTLFITSVFFIVSCGESSEEKIAKQAKHDDSIKKQVEIEVMKKIRRRNDSINLQKSQNNLIEQKAEEKYQNKVFLDSIKKKYSALQRIIIYQDAQLTVLNSRLDDDRRFHLGRVRALKDLQLINDQIKIDSLKMQMSRTTANLNILKNKIQSRNQIKN